MKQIIVVILFILTVSCTQKKSAYVDIQYVFNGFEYKKELEKELIAIKSNRNYLLDSLRTNLKILSNKYEMDKGNKDLIAEFNVARENFLERKSAIEEEEANIIKQSDAKIFKQINSYIKEYGRENDYDYIFGATSSGNIMYADTLNDISKEITEYINKKYKGGK